MSAGLYWGLCVFSPVPACGESWCSEIDPDVVQGEVLSFDGEKDHAYGGKSDKAPFTIDTTL